jgi:RNA polymerase sigma factor (sigma-70 family)
VGSDPCDAAWNLARACARRTGLPDEEARDCAQAFVLRMIRHDIQRHHAGMGSSRFQAWLSQCARNFVIEYGRAGTRRSQRERQWPATSGDSGSGPACDYASAREGPEARLIRGEFWRRMRSAIDQLPAAAREAFARCHLGGECVQDVAAALGCSRHAVEQSLHRARRRLPQLMEGHGLGREELSWYLSSLQPAESTPVRGHDDD